MADNRRRTYCCVFGCLNNSSIPELSLFRLPIEQESFPKDPHLKLKWIEATGRENNWFPTNQSVICSIHFGEDCFNQSGTRRRLFEWATPTLKLKYIFDTSAPLTESLDDSTKSFPQKPSTSTAVDMSVTNLTDTPRKLKLRAIIRNKESLIKSQRMRIKRLQNTKRRYGKKIKYLKEVFEALRNQKLINEDQALHLANTNVSIQDLVNRYNTQAVSGRIVRTEYPASLKSFAMTLHFYSPKAYEFVRHKFATCLPHIRTIKKWYQSVNAKPGFTTESLKALEIKAKYSNKKIVCNLVLDEMAIRQRIEWDGRQMHGYVDIGNTQEGDYLMEAKEVLVFLVTAINGAFKVPVGYFFVNGVSGEQRANLVIQCLELLDKTGIEISSLTFDGCPANVTMVKQLGCVLDVGNDMKTSFEHPCTKEPVFIIFDACHMLKLLRNAFQAYGTFIDSQTRSIKWQFLEKLHELQIKENLHFANKLRHCHVHFHNQKMKVRLASQLFSKSVADALQYCANENQITFSEVEGTINFIKIMNDLFDVLNSRTINQVDFKKALNESNEEIIFTFLDQVMEYLKCLMLPNGSKLVNSGRKTGFLGFIVCIQSLKGIYNKLVKTEKKLQFLPAYRLSQDHLELMFGQVRAHGGCNTNPTARQFMAIYKKLIIKSELRDFDSGNCKSLENISILCCQSAIEKINITSAQKKLWDDSSDDLEDFYEQALFDEEIVGIAQNISDISIPVIVYMAGFVAHALLKKLKCDICVSGLLATEVTHNHRFISLKDRGSLVLPSEDVIDICRKMEGVIKKTVLRDDKFQVSSKFTKSLLVPKALNHFIGTNVFKSIDFHQFDQEPLNNHIIQLIKCVMEKYIDIRLHFLAKNVAPKISKRQVLSKYLHFTGQ